MTDPREARLPKWAQELLEEERTRAALSWPTEPEPEPLVVFDGNGHPENGGAADGALLWAARTGGAYAPPRVECYEYAGLFIRSPGHKNRLSGSRPEGAYYATEDDANLALRWKVARECAQRLRNAGN